MKYKMLFSILMMFIVPNLVFSQKVRKTAKKFTKATLYYTNGETKEGEGKLLSGKYNSSFKFKENGTDKKLNITHHQMDKVIFYTKGIMGNIATTYRFIKIEGNPKPQLLAERMEERRVGLYYITYKDIVPSRASGSREEHTIYFIKKKLDREAVTISAWSKRKYKKKLAKYFADCPELGTKIRAGDFDPKGRGLVKRAFDIYFFLPKILDHYNSKCE